MRLRLDALEGSDPWDTAKSSFNGSGSSWDTWNGTLCTMRRGPCKEKVQKEKKLVYRTQELSQRLEGLTTCTYMMIIMIITFFVCLLFLFRQQNQICTFYCTVFVPLIAQAILVLYVLTDCRKWLCLCMCVCVYVCVCVGQKWSQGLKGILRGRGRRQLDNLYPCAQSYHFIIKDLPHKTFKD